MRVHGKENASCWVTGSLWMGCNVDEDPYHCILCAVLCAAEIVGS